MKFLGRLIMKIGGLDFRPLRLLLKGYEYTLHYDEQTHLMELLKKSNYIILTKRRWNMSSFMVLLASMLLTRRRAYWTHVLMNVEGDNGTAQLMEATGKGVKKSDFFEVFDCDAVTVLRPKIPKISSNFTWEAMNEAAYFHLGKEYDSLADIMSDQKLNCTEYVWKCLQQIPDADTWFHGLKALIDQNKNICPEMFYDCGSFEIVFEVRR